MGRRKVVKVKLTFKGRDPSDPLPYLQAVEAALRPQEIEICVESTEAPASSVPDENLETRVREHVGEILDRRDEQLRQTDSPHPAPPGPSEVARKRQSVMSIVARWIGRGWKVVTNLLPVVKQAVEIAKDVEELRS